MADFEKSDIRGARCVSLDHQGRLEFELANGKIAVIECEVLPPETFQGLAPELSGPEVAAESSQPKTDQKEPGGEVDLTDEEPTISGDEGPQEGQAQGAPAGAQEDSPGSVATQTTE